MGEVDGGIVVLMKAILADVNRDLIGAVEVKNGQDRESVAHTGLGKGSSVRDTVNLQFNKGTIVVSSSSGVVAHTLEANLVDTGGLDGENASLQINQVLGISVNMVVSDNGVGGSTLGVGVVNREDVGMVVLLLNVRQLGIHL